MQGMFLIFVMLQQHRDLKLSGKCFLEKKSCFFVFSAEAVLITGELKMIS